MTLCNTQYSSYSQLGSPFSKALESQVSEHVNMLVVQIAAALATSVALTAAGRTSIVCTPFTGSPQQEDIPDISTGPTCNNPAGDIGITVGWATHPQQAGTWDEKAIISRDGSESATQVACPAKCGSTGHSTENAQCYTFWVRSEPVDVGGVQKWAGYINLNAVWKNGNTFTAIVCNAACLGYDQVSC